MVGKRFADQIAVVTGGGAGIGAATCAQLAAEGARVAVIDIDLSAAERVAAQCGEGSIGLGADISKENDIEAAIRQAQSKLGFISVLINNAAVFYGSELLESDDAHWERVLSTNFLAAVRTIRHVLPDMRRHRFGNVVNVASIQARQGFSESSSYASAKGAMVSLTRQQAVEHGPYGIRVNAVSPGATMTEMNRQRIALTSDPESYKIAMAASSPLGRYAEPDEIAHVITFVASRDASFMTGADVVCDGGSSVYGR